MALGPDRHIDPYGTEINYVCNGVADAGKIMVYGTAGSGSAVPDEKSGVVTVGPSNPSGAKPAGLLLHPFVAYNPLLHRNWYKVTQYPGDKATLLKRGWIVGDNVASGAVPDAGKKAYLGPNGDWADAGPGPEIGEFMSKVDEKGHCRLNVRL